LTLKEILFHNGVPQKKGGDKEKKGVARRVKTRKEALKSLVTIMFQGWQARTVYYGVQASFFFLYLNHLTSHLNLDLDSFA
jgi:hypothetical protein